ncbi:uncharacterized protein LOC101236892 [Hydra vulgaris]|uniref:uncharacterized protein LOC101236892 n=1 Tax=Hydra vulgaris TaxID=6087 RepID=UPI001F5ED1D7|nr:uncharacterized protein LOC101236892 [Hydra vulgaris]
MHKRVSFHKLSRSQAYKKLKYYREQAAINHSSDTDSNSGNVDFENLVTEIPLHQLVDSPSLVLQPMQIPLPQPLTSQTQLPHTPLPPILDDSSDEPVSFSSDEKINIKQELATFVVESALPESATNKLLKQLRKHKCFNDELPKTRKALLRTLTESLSLSTKMAFFYIAGYATRKDDVNENDLFNDSAFYLQLYGDYTKNIDCSKLNIPLDCCVQWVFFCFIIFEIKKNKMCRKSLCNTFMMISDIYNFNMFKKHGTILSNIFLKNNCLLFSPKSNKEPVLKVLKLFV